MKEIVFESYLICDKYITAQSEQQADLKQLEKICKEHLIEYWDKCYGEKERSDEKKINEYEYTEKFIVEYYKTIVESQDEWYPKKKKNDKFLLDVVTKYKESYGIIMDSHDLYECILEKINTEMEDVWKKDDIDVFELYKTKNYDNLLSMLDNRIKEYVTNSLNMAVKTSRFVKITEILNNYRINYSNYDHGITASAVYIVHYYLYQKIIQKSKENKWLRIGFGITNIGDDKLLSQVIDEKYTSDYIGMVGQVIYAILVHNLYPSNFGDEAEK